MSLSHDQISSTASSNTLLPLKDWFLKTIPFLCCHMVHVNATNQHFHLISLIPLVVPLMCCKKWSFRFHGKTPTVFTHDRDSHHKGSVLLQLKNRWAASSSILLLSGHSVSLISTCLLLKFTFVGSLCLKSLHANTAALGGILSFYSSTKVPSSFSLLVAFDNISYAVFVV